MKNKQKFHSIHLYNRTITGATSRRDNRKIREMSGLEVLIKKGIMREAAMYRLKNLAKSFK